MVFFFGKARTDYWAECVNAADQIDDILSYKRGVPAKFFGGEPKYTGNLCRFGELAVVTKTRGKIKAKLDNRGIIFWWAGYTKGHAGDVFRMVNVLTDKVSETKDVVFLDKIYGEVYNSANYLAFKGIKKLDAPRKENEIEVVVEEDEEFRKG